MCLRYSCKGSRESWEFIGRGKKADHEIFFSKMWKAKCPRKFWPAKETDHLFPGCCAGKESVTKPFCENYTEQIADDTGKASIKMEFT